MIKNYNKIELGDKYKYQFFFLSEEAKKVKLYFSAHYNNNNNNEHFNQEEFNYAKLAQQISVITNNSKNYNIIKSMIETEEALRVIISFLFKGFSWNNEILKDFNIDSNLYVKTTISTLRKLDLLISCDGVSLHHILYDSIKMSKGGHIRKSLHQAKIFFISPMFIKFCETLTELFEYKIKSSNNFKHSLYQIMLHSDIFNNELEKIIEEEETKSIRYSIDDNGTIYGTDTIHKIRFKDELKFCIAEHKVMLLGKKKDLGLLTYKENKSLSLVECNNNPLMVLEEQSKLKKNKNKLTITYKGSNLTKNDLDLLESNIIQNDIMIENSKTELGHLDNNSINEQRKTALKELDKLKLSDEIQRIDPLIKFIKHHKKVNVDKIAKNLRLNDSYNLFLDKCIENGIKTDNEYFYYKELKPIDEVNEIFKKLNL